MHAEDNPVMIAQIFLSMKELIIGHYEENVKSLGIIYESIRGFYIIGAKNASKKYKTDVVIDYLKKYLEEYDRLQKDRTIDTDTPLDQIVIRIKSELDAYQL